MIKMQNGNEAFYRVVPAKVRENVDQYLKIEIGDARKQPVSDETVDLVITSSPYVTSYEYADLHQLSTIWLDLADDLKEYKNGFIGTSYKKYENKRLKGSIAADIVDKMSKKVEKRQKKSRPFSVIWKRSLTRVLEF